MPKESYFKATLSIDFKTHNGNKIINEYINDVLIPISAEEHQESTCEALSSKN